MLFMESVTILDWVERLGGWGVVAFIVYWGMRRMDKMIDTFQQSLRVFQKFEQAEERTHRELREVQNRMLQTQNKILEEIKDLRKSMA